MGRNRDLSIESNGKGDANRTSDGSAYRENYEAIDWKTKPKPVDGFAGLNAIINPEWETATYAIEEPSFESWDR